MPAPLSVIIPTRDAAASLGSSLAALVPGLTRGLIRELIIADAGSTDETLKVAEDAGATILRKTGGRGPQLSAGADAAKGDWLLFLHADCELATNWPDAVTRHIATRPAKAGYFALAFDRNTLPARLTAGWANLRSRLFGLPYGDQGLLIPRALYTACGGYPPIPLMEDVAIARALRGALLRLDATATTSAERYLRDGWLRRGWRNLTTLALYFLGRDPAKLAARYHR